MCGVCVGCVCMRARVRASGQAGVWAGGCACVWASVHSSMSASVRACECDALCLMVLHLVKKDH